MLQQLKKFYRTLKQDAYLLFSRPEAKIDAKANKNYWETRRKNYSHSLNDFQRFRVEFIKNCISRKAQILDLGTGTGDQVIELKKLGYGVVCSDFSDEARNIIETNGLKFIKCDLSDETDLKLFSNYDVLIACEVLEHIQNPENVFDNFLKSRASMFIFSVPNSGYFIYRLRLLFGSFPVQWRVHPGEHVRYWTLNDMKWWLQNFSEHNYESNISCYEGWPILGKIFPSLFAKGMIVSIRK